VPVERTAIADVLVVRWPVLDDARGFLRQTHQLPELVEALGREPGFVQGNHARSHPGVLRGFHAEPWDKLVQVVAGTALACVADVRPESPSYGTVVDLVLGDPPGERAAVFVPEGVANAYRVLGDRPCDYHYLVSACWTPDAPRTVVAWDDPDLAAPWDLAAPPLLSATDAAAPRLRELHPDHPRWTGTGGAA